MPRIPTVSAREQLAEDKRHIWDEITASRGQVQGPFSVLLHSPEFASRAAHLGAYVRFESDATLPSHIRETAVLIAARLMDCGYEFAAHSRQASAAGISEETLAAIRGRRPEGLPADERWLFDFVQQVIEQHRVTDATFQEAQRRLGLQGLVELAATIGYYGMLAAALNTFAVEPAEIPA